MFDDNEIPTISKMAALSESEQEIVLALKAHIGGYAMGKGVIEDALERHPDWIATVDPVKGMSHATILETISQKPSVAPQVFWMLVCHQMELTHISMIQDAAAVYQVIEHRILPYIDRLPKIFLHQDVLNVVKQSASDTTGVREGSVRRLSINAEQAIQRLTGELHRSQANLVGVASIAANSPNAVSNDPMAAVLLANQLAEQRQERLLAVFMASAQRHDQNMERERSTSSLDRSRALAQAGKTAGVHPEGNEPLQNYGYLVE